MSRRRAREVVLQILYQRDLNSDPVFEVEDDFLRGRLHNDDVLFDFAKGLVRGVVGNKEKLDEHLQAAADNWRISRMAVTDRAVLRLGAYEILMSDTPDRVAINEAIDLAKRYGTKNSAQFVNGILDRLLKSANQPKPEKGTVAEETGTAEADGESEKVSDSVDPQEKSG